MAQRQRGLCLQCRRPRFNPWVRKIPWSRPWQPTPVFLPAEFHGQKNLVGCSPWGHKESDMTELLTVFQNKWLTSVQFCRSVMSDSFRPHGLQHARPPCPPPTPRACSYSCPLSWWCHPTISSSVIPFYSFLPSIFPPIRVFSNESVLYIRWPKYWILSFNISPSSEYSGLISFRIDWFDVLAVQGTLKSLLQHHSSKAWILRRSALFMVQLSHPYMTTGKAIALNRWTLVGKVMSVLFNMLSRFVIAFFPRSRHLLISCLELPSAVILEPKKNKVSHCFHCFPIYLLWSDGTRCHDLSFFNVEF